MDRGVVGDHPQAAGARGWGQERYVRAGGPGWRRRLISQAPQLGRTGDGALLPPVYAARSPAPLTRGSGGVPLRTGDTICPHAPRLQGRHPIRQEERGGEREDGEQRAHPVGRVEGSGAGRAEPRSVRADGNRGSERGEGDARR